jgi:hypothetical protein
VALFIRTVASAHCRGRLFTATTVLMPLWFALLQSTTTLCVSWRHRLRDICLNAAPLLFFKATSGVCSSSSQLYGSP